MRRMHALAALAAAPLATAAPRRLGAQPVEKIQVAGPPTEDMTNLYYAIKNGLFTRDGVSVELIATASGTAATAAVIAGTYDIAKTALTAIFAAHARGIPVAIVAPEIVYRKANPFALLQVAADAPYKTGADLDGKTLGIPALNDLNALAARAWVDKNGGNWRSLRFVEIPNSAMEAALQQRRVDAAVLQSPQLDASLAAGTTKTLGDAYGAISQNFMFGAYVARREWATAHADALRRFNHALGEATAYVNVHLTETIPLVAELTKIGVENLAKMHRSYNATSLDPALIQPFIEAAAKYEHIPQSFPAREILL